MSYNTIAEDVSLFLAHRFDFKSKCDVIGRHQVYADLFAGTGFAVKSMADEYMVAKYSETDVQLIERSCSVIDSCNYFVLDLSERGWTYIGSIFELCYAVSKGIPAFCYAATEELGDRPWLRHHCKKVTTSHIELRDAMLDFSRQKTLGGDRNNERFGST